MMSMLTGVVTVTETNVEAEVAMVPPEVVVDMAATEAEEDTTEEDMTEDTAGTDVMAEIAGDTGPETATTGAL